MRLGRSEVAIHSCGGVTEECLSEEDILLSLAVGVEEDSIEGEGGGEMEDEGMESMERMPLSIFC